MGRSDGAGADGTPSRRSTRGLSEPRWTAAAAREHGAKGILINYPNNPSGAVPTRDQIGEIVDAAVAENLWIISDEIYARLIYDGLTHVSPANFDRATAA